MIPSKIQFRFRTFWDILFFKISELKTFWTFKQFDQFWALQNSEYFWTSHDSEHIPRSPDLDHFRAVVVRPSDTAGFMIKQTKLRSIVWMLQMHIVSNQGFAQVCVAAQIAVTVTSLYIFREKNRDMCMLFHAKNPVTFCTRIQTRNPFAFVCLMHNCVVCLVIVYLFVCHPDTYAWRHSYIFITHRRTQSKFREANSRPYRFT